MSATDPTKQLPPSAGNAARLAFVCAFCMIAQQVGGKSVRDALFLSNFSADRLPLAMLGAASLSIPSALATSKALASLGPARLIPIVFSLSSAMFAVEWLLLDSAPGAAAIAMFLHVAVLGSIALSGFWSVINERFDPHTAKLVIGRISGGATLGGLAGGALTERVSSLLNMGWMLLILGGLNVGCAVLISGLGGPPAKPRVDPSGSSVAGFSQSPYLRQLGLLVGATALTATLIDYVMKAEAAAQFTSRDELVSFFAMFYTGTSVLTFGLQTLVTRRALARLGLGGTLAILPAIVASLGVLGAVAARLWTAAVLRAAESIVANSFFRSGYELLYTPLPRAQKRRAKTIIDVGFDRLGDALGSGLILVLLALIPAFASSITLGLAAAIALGSLWLSLRLHHGYIDELAASLRAGRVELQESEVVDATTKFTLSQTMTSLDRQSLLREIEKLRREREANQEQEGEPQDRPAQRHSTLSPPSATDADFIRQAKDLLSGDVGRIRQVLDKSPDIRTTPLIIDSLQHDEIGESAVLALSKMLGVIGGQLADALLDSDRPLALRRRIPRILRGSNDRRNLRALAEALNDDEFEIRYRSARALLGAKQRGAHWMPSDATVWSAMERELNVPRERWLEQNISLDVQDVASLASINGPGRSLEHIFTLLSLRRDPEAVMVAYRALQADDLKLRGTAIEYLENVVPERLRLKLSPHLKAPAGKSLTPPTEEPPPPSRSTKALAEELKRSMVGFDATELRQRLGK